MSFSEHGVPALFTLFVWWFSTGAILYLDGLPAHTYRWSMAGATVVLAAAFAGLAATAGDASTAGVYCAFSCAILVWGWIEMSFLMGWITGPRRTACPPGATGWKRLTYAFEAIAWHEVALLVGLLAVAACTWGAPNQFGVWTFLALWIARQSTKVNLFLGVRNFSEDFLPEQLKYLQTYFTRRPLNPLFPLSVSVFSVAAAMLWNEAFNSTDPALAAGYSLLATLLTLAVLEHWFLILPINFGKLWEWGMGSRRDEPTARP
jgi:putative photosynthetic complex assembly protein 2